MLRAVPAPRLSGIVVDCPDPRVLAEFYRRLLGWPYAPGHESDDPAGDEWLVLRSPAGPDLAFQLARDFRPPTWPDSSERGQMMHLDLRVEDLDAEHDRVLSFGARPLAVSQDPEDVFRVYADPAGHPFCLCLDNSLSTTG
jgi:hypothetical protein